MKIYKKYLLRTEWFVESISVSQCHVMLIYCYVERCDKYSADWLTTKLMLLTFVCCRIHTWKNRSFTDHHQPYPNIQYITWWYIIMIYSPPPPWSLQPSRPNTSRLYTYRILVKIKNVVHRFNMVSLMNLEVSIIYDLWI